MRVHIDIGVFTDVRDSRVLRTRRPHASFLLESLRARLLISSSSTPDVRPQDGKSSPLHRSAHRLRRGAVGPHSRALHRSPAVLRLGYHRASPPARYGILPGRGRRPRRCLRRARPVCLPCAPHSICGRMAAALSAPRALGPHSELCALQVRYNGRSDARGV
jgi:hypothetical protein